MNFLKKLSLALQVIGLTETFRTFPYTLNRDYYNRKFRQPEKGKRFVPKKPGEIKSFTRISQGGVFTFENGFTLTIVFKAPDMVVTTWEPGSLPAPYAQDETEWPSIEVKVREEPGSWCLVSERLVVCVFSGGGLHYQVPNGEVIRQDLPPILEGTIWTHNASLPPDERIFGLGERTTGLNLRGRTFRFWNKYPGGSYGPGEDPIYLTIPVYLSISRRGSYLIFHENSFDGSITFPDNGPVAARFQGGALQTYFIYGDPTHLLKRFSQLTGRPPLPPRWALGFHQSRWGYKNEADIREVAEGFKNHQLPIRSIHLDIDYMDGYRVFTVDQTRYPNLKSLSEEMLLQGIHLVTILDPGVKYDPDYDVYKSGEQEGVFCMLPDDTLLHAVVWPGWCAFPDFTNPKTRTWWGSFYPRLLETGIAGIWHDMNEPSVFSSWGDPTLPRATRHDFDGRGGNHLEGHNLFALLMARAGFEALIQYRPERRPWLLTRSGWAGIQRYSWHWTGDIEASWSALKMTIPEVLGLGLSGIPYSGVDIGGFSGMPTPELFTRWFELSAFLPFFRNHAAIQTPRSEPWVFGDLVLSICRKYLQLREQLMPYLYTLAWEASQTGAPLIRPLFWIDEKNQYLWEINDAFLLGDSLLVAPITSQGAVARTLHMPRMGWYDFFTGKLLPDDQVLTLEAPLDHIPVLVREGSVIPLTEDGNLHLHIYPTLHYEAKGVHYDDIGDGYGDWRLEWFTLKPEDDHLVFIWTRKGEYPFSYNQIILHFHGMQVKKASIDGVPTNLENINQVRSPGAFDQVQIVL